MSKSATVEEPLEIQGTGMNTRCGCYNGRPKSRYEKKKKFSWWVGRAASYRNGFMSFKPGPLKSHDRAAVKASNIETCSSWWNGRWMGDRLEALSITCRLEIDLKPLKLDVDWHFVED